MISRHTTAKVSFLLPTLGDSKCAVTPLDHFIANSIFDRNVLPLILQFAQEKFPSRVTSDQCITSLLSRLRPSRTRRVLKVAANAKWVVCASHKDVALYACSPQLSLIDHWSFYLSAPHAVGVFQDEILLFVSGLHSEGVIEIYGLDGNRIRQWHPPFWPMALTVDETGCIYLADNKTVHVYSWTGEFQFYLYILTDFPDPIVRPDKMVACQGRLFLSLRDTIFVYSIETGDRLFQWSIPPKPRMHWIQLEFTVDTFHEWILVTSNHHPESLMVVDFQGRLLSTSTTTGACFNLAYQEPLAEKSRLLFVNDQYNINVMDYE